MATFNSNLVAKRLRHRGLYEGKEQTISAAYRLRPGTSLTTADVLRMVPLGENVRPIRATVFLKEVSGTPVLTGGASTLGVLADSATALARPDGKSFPPLATAATKYGAVALAQATPLITVTCTPAPSEDTKWGPFYVTLTPTATTSVAGGEVDIVVEVVFTGEIQEEARIYDEWNSAKYKN